MTLTSKFIKVQCTACGNQQVIFNKSATYVKCLACGKTLAKPTGGRSVILGKIIKTLE